MVEFSYNIAIVFFFQIRSFPQKYNYLSLQQETHLNYAIVTYFSALFDEGAAGVDDDDVGNPNHIHIILNLI